MIATQELFSEIYLQFTHWFSQVQVREEETGVRVPEKTIRCIWNDQLFHSGALKTTDQENLEILFPGYWNFGPGPDFRSAVIKVNGITYEGDVEIHVYSTDWKTHGHSANPDFDKVVLHVFLWKGRGKRRPAHHRIPQKPHPQPGEFIYELELKDYLTKGIMELTDELDFDSYPVLHQFNYGLCHKPLSKLSQEKLAHLLNAAGDARVFRKMERFHDRVIINGYEQTLYEGVAEALGYPNNKEPFQTLAETLPLAALKKLIPSRIGKPGKLIHLQALLFGMAGLIDSKSFDTAGLPTKDRNYFEKVRGIWNLYRGRLPASRLEARDWKFGGIRPANFPYRRIAGLAHLLVRHESNGLFGDYLGELQSAISLSGNKGYTVRVPRTLNDFFCVDAADYWASHYSPGGKPLRLAQQLIGPSRSREIIINIAIPIGLIYARASKSVELEAALHRIFQSGKKTSDNRLMRFMKHYIFGNEEKMLKVLSNDKQIQGLMQVYQDFCTQNENNCLRCQFPDVVTKYFS
ncbi:MAG: DUF2851 family protein [Nitrospinaceae bacterium]